MTTLRTRSLTAGLTNSRPALAASQAKWTTTTYTPSAPLAARNIASSSKLSSPAPPPASPSPSSSSPTSPTSPQVTLTWDQYLRLRKSRRLAGLATSVPSTLLAAAASGSYFLGQEIDPAQQIGGIEPLYVYGALTIASTGLGYLIGPSLGSSIWSLFHRSKLPQINQKDADFYEHIKRNRVDPSRTNMQNPIPDFYGEKISSLKEYRRWLRDCSVYRRKAAHGLKEEEEAAAEKGTKSTETKKKK
ncbi:Pam17-domain-containing protein [Microstroma glucosiphilum]|uniref:Presequence translocated-associated motor subunit PAM17 n=1 Tax=Pseudomicrostroma glucosiphilum TaxID=1684307 RepID=A0A316UDY1_9BASI|nr:Pam17-domain-containing protein [Pseudomicrostroma glucosiphilum]PWN23410.1 Pam17-domain-containing protein [Pseudomicrostroma glucosiphilum]